MKYHYSHRHRIYIYEPFIDQTFISSLYPKIFLEPVYVRTTISQTKGRGVEYMYFEGGIFVEKRQTVFEINPLLAQ